MEDQKIQPSFYANIPANVRYDKKLCANAKLLYGEITALTNKNGYAWAGNEYFADLYEVSLKTVSRWVSQLETEGYIKRVMIYKENSKEIKQRHIYINQNGVFENVSTGEDKKEDTYGQKCQVGGDKKEEDITTSFNTTFNNLKDIVPAKAETAVQVNKMPDEMINMILNYFTNKMEKARPFGKSDSTIKLLDALYKAGHKDIGMYQFVIDNKYNQWINDDKMKQYLKPGTIFAKSNFEKYLDEDEITVINKNNNESQTFRFGGIAYGEETSSGNTRFDGHILPKQIEGY